MNVQHQVVVGDLKEQIEELECQIELRQTLMEQERLRQEGEIQNLQGELRKVCEQNEQDKDALQVALTEYRKQLRYCHEQVRQLNENEHRLRVSNGVYFV